MKKHPNAEILQYRNPGGQTQPRANVIPFSNLNTVTENVDFSFWGGPVTVEQDGTWSCPGFVGKTFADSIWDKVHVGPEQYTPGVCEVYAIKDRRFDEKRSAGADGARITFNGLNPGRVDIRITIWTPEQLRQLISLWPVLFPGPQKVQTTKTVPTTIQGPPRIERTVNPRTGVVTTQSFATFKNKIIKVDTNKLNVPVQAFDVSHPALEPHGIKSVVFFAGEGPVPGNIPKSKMFTMRAIEFIPAAKKGAVATTTPVGALSSKFDAGHGSTPGSDPANTGAE